MLLLLRQHVDLGAVKRHSQLLKPISPCVVQNRPAGARIMDSSSSEADWASSTRDFCCKACVIYTGGVSLMYSHCGLTFDRECQGRMHAHADPRTAPWLSWTLYGEHQ